MDKNTKTTVFDPLLGKTIVKIEGAEAGSDEIRFTTQDGGIFRMYHEQDCCESVDVEDVIGCIDHLIGSPILLAQEVISEGTTDDDNTYTWTWYNFATVKGYVTIRWYGESNGYYSESVDYEWIEKGEER